MRSRDKKEKKEHTAKREKLMQKRAIRIDVPDFLPTTRNLGDQRFHPLAVIKTKDYFLVVFFFRKKTNGVYRSTGNRFFFIDRDLFIEHWGRCDNNLKTVWYYAGLFGKRVRHKLYSDKSRLLMQWYESDIQKEYKGRYARKL